MRHSLTAALLAMLLAIAGVAGAGEAPLPAAVLERVWAVLEEDLHDAERAATRLTPEARARLDAAAAQSADLYAFAPVLDAFLRDLGVSHTSFHTDRDIDWYFFRSLFSTRDPDRPPVHHLGAQFTRVDGEQVVRWVLDGGPADVAGLRRGDVLHDVGGAPFDPFASIEGGAPIVLEVSRAGRTFPTSVAPVFESPHRSFIDATRRSMRTIEHDGRRFGYLRLWVGTHEETIGAVEHAATVAFAEHDGMILDLRGGFGGAWHRHLDPFFENRDEFFEATLIARDGTRTVLPTEPVEPHRFFDGPLVVLIDGGTRSGKEAVAYQLRKRPDTRLVGTTTAGAFTAGRGTFADEDVPYLLYMAVAELELDGNPIEGVGVAPHVEVPYPLRDAPSDDPQLARGLAELSALVAGKGGPQCSTSPRCAQPDA